MDLIEICEEGTVIFSSRIQLLLSKFARASKLSPRFLILVRANSCLQEIFDCQRNADQRSSAIGCRDYERWAE